MTSNNGWCSCILGFLFASSTMLSCTGFLLASEARAGPRRERYMLLKSSKVSEATQQYTAAHSNTHTHTQNWIPFECHVLALLLYLLSLYQLNQQTLTVNTHSLCTAVHISAVRVRIIRFFLHNAPQNTAVHTTAVTAVEYCCIASLGCIYIIHII